MSSHLKSGLTGLLLISFFLSPSCRKHKDGWPVEINCANGIQVVKNPAEPYYGELVFELEEDLAIGNRNSGNVMFSGIAVIRVDDRGNLFVLDTRNHRIHKFNGNGNHLRTFGRKGQGPGEFEYPNRLYLDGDGNIIVSEMRKIQMFNPEGDFMKLRWVPFHIMDFVPAAEGNLIVYGLIRTDKGENFVIQSLDWDGETIRKIADFYGFSFVRKGDTVFRYSHSYSPFLHFSHMEKAGFVYGYSLEYKLFVSDRSGKTDLIIEKDERSETITAAEKHRIIDDTLKKAARSGSNTTKDDLEKAANFPPHKPFFSRLTTDDQQRIYVWKLKSILDVNTDEEGVECDIFGPDGCFLYTAKFLSPPFLIHDGYLYDKKLIEDTNEEVLVRYRIRNWLKIKSDVPNHAIVPR
ncbi:MAG: 6-bladed beta-propeller [Acidobacteriota bacterium]|nr:6-bladed beta-propeller [Acidobacteriota bacterium]